MGLKINIRESQGVTILDLSGDFTSPQAYTGVREQVKQLLSTGQAKLIINLAEVRQLDSGGLGTLVEAATSVRKRARELRLANAPEKIKRVFILTNLASFFEMHDTEEQALASFR